MTYKRAFPDRLRYAPARNDGMLTFFEKQLTLGNKTRKLLA